MFKSGVNGEELTEEWTPGYTTSIFKKRENAKTTEAFA